MQIKYDRMRITTAPVDRVGGAAPEPEERPMTREIGNEIAVSVGDSANDPNATKLDHGLGSTITAEGTVQEYVEAFTSQCYLCRHWSNDGWLREKKRMAASTDPADRASLNDMRSVFMEIVGTKPDEIEKALDESMGLCAALSLATGEPMLTHSMATCPQGLPNGAPFVRAFAPRDAAARKAAGMIKDSILRTAQSGQP